MKLVPLTVFMEEMTRMEIRDALKAGKGTVGHMKHPGIKQVDEGLHDDYAIASMIALVDPASIHLKQRAVEGKDSINGAKLSPLSTTQANARKIVEHRVDETIAALQEGDGRAEIEGKQ